MGPALALLLVAAYGPNSQLDINHGPSLAQIRELPVDSATAQAIYDYLQLYGRLNSIYDLLKVPGINPAKLEELKPLIRVTPIDWEAIRTENVQRVQRRLAAEDGPTAAVVEEWQDRVLMPLNINRTTIDELLALENVSLVDAVAVVKYLKSGARIESRRDLATRVEGLSSYGYRGMRSYVTFDDVRPMFFGGNYRVKFENDPNWSLETTTAELAQALSTLVTDSAEFRQAGFSQAELEFVRARLEAEQRFRTGMNNQASVRHRLRVRLGEKFRAGLWTMQKLYEARPVSGVKSFGLVQELGPVKRLMLGDYRLTLGQGLVMDNNSELMPRTHERTQGLFNDLNENPGFGLRGVAADLGLGRAGFLGFYSRAHRDAILNPDSSVNYYIVTTPRYPTFQDVVKETDMGGNLRLDLSDLMGIPTGTRVGFNALATSTSRSFRPDARFLDLPGDAEVLDDPNYTRLDTGRTRRFYGADFRTVVENVSCEGEYARQQGGGNALVAKVRGQYDYLYVTVLYRHYDINYNNPYNRGYCEQLRFEDTPLEKAYRLIDPTYQALQDFPMPKAEQGFLIETRYQLSRQITFTRVYLDVWRNRAWAADNFRFQGEVEYRPVFPVRLRFKEKLQLKENPKIAGATTSFTMESGLRAMLSLTNWDYLTGELRYGRVLVTPTMKYQDQSSLSGDFLSVQWEHNFSDDFNTELGIASWMARGMSEWLFEDMGIDFVDGQGFKWYAAISDRLSDNLLLYLKVRHKLSDFPHTGLGNAGGVHYPGSTEPVRDFVTRNSRFDIRVQLDLLW